MVEGLIAALLLALLLTAIAALLFRRTGPWGAAWSFFLFLFLVLWTISIYFRSIGPVYWGVAWLPLLFSAVLLALLLAKIIPDANRWRDESLKESAIREDRSINKIRNPSRQRSGGLFWFMVVILVIALVVGMINPQMAL